MSEPTLDSIVAAKLGMHPEQVGAYRQEWEKQVFCTVVRELLHAKLQRMVDEQDNKLRTCEPEELKGIQGARKAFELAQKMVVERLV